MKVILFGYTLKVISETVKSFRNHPVQFYVQSAIDELDHFVRSS